jgi:hypothetical protein
MPYYLIFPILVNDISILIWYYLLAPALFYIPYKFSKLTEKKEKLFFILFGLILPLILFYFFLAFEFWRTFQFGF